MVADDLTPILVTEADGSMLHDDVIKCKHLPRYWPFVQGIHRSPMNSPHKGQWRGASLICTWLNGWVNNGEAGNLRSHRAYYDVTVMLECPKQYGYSLLPKRNVGDVWLYQQVTTKPSLTIKWGIPDRSRNYTNPRKWHPWLLLMPWSHIVTKPPYSLPR